MADDSKVIWNMQEVGNAERSGLAMLTHRRSFDQNQKMNNGEMNDPVFDDSDYMVEASSSALRIPTRIADFLCSFNLAFVNKDLSELQNLYENVWPVYCERFYSKSPWPPEEVVARAIINKALPDPIFLIVYKWLYYCHIHEHFALQIRDYIDCYANYCSLFNTIMPNGDPNELTTAVDLPSRMIWDMVDFFITQFEIFNIKRAQINSQTHPEIVEILKEKSEIWDIHSILNVLYSFIHTSKINEQLIASKTGGDVAQAAGKVGTKHAYRVFGYCSLVCLMRVQCILGDYIMALEAVEHLDLSSKGLLSRITPCHITYYYYLGFTYMMLRRYSDAVNTFTHILLFISRIKNIGNKTHQVEEINNKADCIYALLAICVTITKQRVDESIHNILREKHGDSIAKMQKSSVEEATNTAAQLFNFACPQFVSPNSIFFEETPEAYLLPIKHQISCFAYEMRLQFTTLSTAARLKSYTAIKLDKLASFCNKSPEEIVSELIIYKNISLDSKKVSENNSSVTYDNYQTPPEIDFYIDDDILYISRTKQPRRIGEWIIRNTCRINEVIALLKTNT